jgi:hypothetical protein
MKWDCQHVYDRLHLAWSSGRLGHAYLVLGDFPSINARVLQPLLPHLLGSSPHQKAALTPWSETGAIGVEEAREFLSEMSHPPAEGTWRVGIVEDAQRLTRGAANSLLKGLEEAGPQRIFLLHSPQSGLVLKTISSRCQTLPVRDALWSVPGWLSALMSAPSVLTPFDAWSMAGQMMTSMDKRREERQAQRDEKASSWKAEDFPPEVQRSLLQREDALLAQESDRDWRNTLRALSRRWPALARACDQAQSARLGIIQPGVVLGSILLHLTRP